MDLTSAIAQVTPQVVAWRRDLHRHPELGGQEHRTADFIAQRLRELGLEPKRPTATGVVADIEGDGPALVALRADMDGLPLLEASGEPFSSERPGVMHACGHDAHVAMLLGAAAVLCPRRRELGGRVRLIFQPSEERLPGGALELIEAGVLQGVDRVFGLHIWSTLDTGVIALSPGPVMANADEFRIRVVGRGTHGAEPHRGVDAAVAACAIVVNLQAVVSRRLDPMETGVVTVGTVAAGTAFNIVAERAELTGTLRSFTPEVRKLLAREVDSCARHTAEAFGATCEFEYRPGYPAVVNHAAEARAVAQACRDFPERPRVEEQRPMMGGEDFAYYLEAVPGAFAFLGARPDDGATVAHHSPHTRFNERAFPLGVRLLASAATTLLGMGP